MKIVLDTNILLLPFTHGTNLEGGFEELFGVVELVIPTSVISELQKLSENGGKTGQAAKAALKLADKFHIEKTGRMGDDGILEVARRIQASVATNDRVLQQEARKSGLLVLHARENGRLQRFGSGSG